MEKNFHFTQANVGKLILPAGGRMTYRDTATPGLYLTVTVKGNKTFSYVKRIGPRVARVTLGRYPPRTVEAARKQARHLAGEMAQGADPTVNRWTAREEMPLGELFDLYLENYAKVHKKSWKGDENSFKAYLTGWRPRRSNVQAMDWADVDLEWELWRIPAEESKNAEPLLCVLPPAAVDILRQRAECRTTDNPYVFPGGRKGCHVVNLADAWKDILGRAGIKNLRIHDLRRTVGS